MNLSLAACVVGAGCGRSDLLPEQQIGIVSGASSGASGAVSGSSSGVSRGSGSSGESGGTGTGESSGTGTGESSGTGRGESSGSSESGAPLDAEPPPIDASPMLDSTLPPPPRLDASVECATASDCTVLLGQLPSLCVSNCPGGALGCEHYICSAGTCVTTFCGGPSTAECQTTQDCEALLGPLPEVCVAKCPSGQTGCAHYVCVVGLCQTTYCD